MPPSAGYFLYSVLVGGYPSPDIPSMRIQHHKPKVEVIPRGIQILGEDDISEFEKLEELGFGGGGKVYIVLEKQTFAMKEMKIKNAEAKIFQNFLGEYEIMNLFNLSNIILNIQYYLFKIYIE